MNVKRLAYAILELLVFSVVISVLLVPVFEANTWMITFVIGLFYGWIRLYPNVMSALRESDEW